MKMKLNNFMFKEEYAYSYEEVLNALLNEEWYFLDQVTLSQILQRSGYIDLNELNNEITSLNTSFSFISSVGEISEVVSERAIDVLNKVAMRYKHHYAILIEDENEMEYESYEFFTKVCNVLDYTFVKYDTLLNMYENQKSHLLDKLSRVRSEEKEHSLEGEHSNTIVRDEDKSNSASGQHSTTKGTEVDTESSSASKTAGSDTPQTINVGASFDELKGYFNKYDQGADEGTSHSEGSETDSGTNSSSGTENIDVEETDNGTSSSSGNETIEATETYDPTTLMARIDEVQKQFDNVMLKWVNEFDRLFIEEGNI